MRETIAHWIPIEKQLPPRNTRVLAVLDTGHWQGVVTVELTHMGWSATGDDYYYREEDVTHWAPCPPLPERRTRGR